MSCTRSWSWSRATTSWPFSTNSFTAMSVFANGELFGMVYADRHTSDCQLDNVSYNYFKKFCNSLGQALHVLQRAS